MLFNIMLVEMCPSDEPMSKNMGRFRQEYTGSHRNMEAVFRPENFRIFSGAFRSHSSTFRQELVRNHPKKFRNFQLEYCFHVPVTSGVFLQVPSGSGDRNLRPEKSYFDLSWLMFTDRLKNVDKVQL